MVKEKSNTQMNNDIYANLNTKELLNECKNISGVYNIYNIVSEYVDYIKLCKKGLFSIKNYNIIINDESTYSIYEDVARILYYILKNEKIIEGKFQISHLGKGEFKFGASNYAIINLESNLVDNEKMKEIIRKNKDKVFILISSTRTSRYSNNIDKYFMNEIFWKINLREIEEKNKNKFINSYLHRNKIKISKDCNIVERLENLELWEIKEKLFRLTVMCSKNKSNLINNKQFNKIMGNDKEIKKAKNIKKIKEKSGMSELNEIIGLENIKEQILQIINYITICKKKGKMPMLHMVFEGNPGCCKTSIARVIGKIFAEKGILSKKKIFVEADRESLVGEYIGDTAVKTKEIIQMAEGGVLFIDEAYNLCNMESKKDFGYEAVATLIKEMEDKRDKLCVILAGYPQEMEELLKTNPGFESRIQFKLHFPDYTVNEMYEIFKLFCKKDGYKLSSNIKNIVEAYFNEEKKNKNFANGRCARNLFEKIKFVQASRIIKDEKSDTNLIIKDDVIKAIEQSKKQQNKNETTRKIGFRI